MRRFSRGGCQVKERGLKVKMKPIAEASALAVGDMEVEAGAAPVALPVQQNAQEPKKRRLIL